MNLYHYLIAYDVDQADGSTVTRTEERVFLCATEAEAMDRIEAQYPSWTGIETIRIQPATVRRPA